MQTLVLQADLLRSKVGKERKAVTQFERLHFYLAIELLLPMYSKQEASKLRQEFWTAFGLYMAPVLSSEGEKLNWLNYKTGIKHIHFRMHADNKQAYIAIELTHKDVDIREIFFRHFEQLRKIKEEISEEQWTWQLHDRDDEGKLISRIYTSLSPVNVFNKEDWPTLISFFKRRMIVLDEFWNMVKYGFETLQ